MCASEMKQSLVWSSEAGMQIAQAVPLFSNKYISLVRGGIGGAEPTLSEESLSVMAAKAIISVCALLGVPVVLPSPKTLPVTTTSSSVVLSVPAVEVRLTVAGISLSMVRGGSGGGRSSSRS